RFGPPPALASRLLPFGPSLGGLLPGWRHSRPPPARQHAECADHPLLPLAQQRGENVLADLLAPEMVAAVAARVGAAVEVHPVVHAAAGHPVAPMAYPLS